MGILNKLFDNQTITAIIIQNYERTSRNLRLSAYKADFLGQTIHGFHIVYY